MAVSERAKRNAEKNRSYWAAREAEQLKHNITDEREYDKELQRIYKSMLDSIQSQIDGFYGRYASKEGITLAEAKKRVAKLDIEAYERKAERYVKEKNFSPKANEQMRLYNLTMKVNRLEMLKANVGLEMIAGHDEIEKFMAGILQGRTMDELERQAGILGKTVRNNAQKANAIVNASFHNATFSDRIWQYQDLMRIELDRLLQTGLIQGKNPRAIAKDLQKYWYGNDPATGGGALYCMERLMRTELARVQTEAQKQSFVRNGFEEYMFIVNGGCCEICADLNGKHFKVAKMRPGENAPPMHPHCRCSVAAWEDSKEYNEWLDYLASGGTTENWNKLKADPNRAEREKLIASIRSKSVWNGLADKEKDAIIRALNGGDIRFIRIAEAGMDKVKATWNVENGSEYKSGRIYLRKGASADEFWHEYGHFMDDARTAIDLTKKFGYTPVSRARKTGYKDAAIKDVSTLLKKFGLSDKYELKEVGESGKLRIFRKSNGAMVQEGVTELNEGLQRIFDDLAGTSKTGDYLKSLGYPQAPKYEDYFEFYTTPKRQTLKERPRYKGAQAEYEKAMSAYNHAVDEFEKTHDMKAIFAEQERLRNESEKRAAALGGATDTLDGSTGGAFGAAISMRGHGAEYYDRDNGVSSVQEGVANVFSANITGDAAALEGFKAMCPELYKSLTGAWLDAYGVVSGSEKH